MRMAKYILSIILCGMFLTAVPTSANAEAAIEIVDNDFSKVQISLSGNVLKVSGASGLMLQVYNIAGVRVMNVKIEGDECQYNLSLPRGCYIVKVGKVVRKVSIR